MFSITKTPIFYLNCSHMSFILQRRNKKNISIHRIVNLPGTHFFLGNGFLRHLQVEFRAQTFQTGWSCYKLQRKTIHKVIPTICLMQYLKCFQKINILHLVYAIFLLGDNVGVSPGSVTSQSEGFPAIFAPSKLTQSQQLRDIPRRPAGLFPPKCKRQVLSGLSIE